MDIKQAKKLNSIFAPLAERNIWITWQRVEREDGKLDKVPSNGQYKISYTNGDNLTPLNKALKNAKAYDLGVGIVLNGATTYDDHILLGIDIDKANLDHPDLKKLLFVLGTYAELSPSGKGVRAFAWVPVAWFEAYRDTVAKDLTFCDHIEFYIGTSPRFLTVTFNPLQALPIQKLDAQALNWLEPWFKPKEKPQATSAPLTPGQVLDLDSFNLTSEQRALYEGRWEGMDRSAVMHGLLVSILEQGASKEAVLATLTGYQTLWQYCLDHRNNKPERAQLFANNEVERAWGNTIRGRQARLSAFNSRWLVDMGLPTNEEPEAPQEVPDTFYGVDLDHPPGLIGELADAIDAGAIYVHRRWAVMAALTAVSAISGNNYVIGEDMVPLNLYSLLLGPTASGKDWYRKAAELILLETGNEGIPLSDVSSGQALLRRLQNAPNLLLSMDEMAHTVAAMEGKNNTHGMQLEKELLSLYGAALTHYTGKGYADSKHNVPVIHNPYVQLLGATTPVMFWGLMRSQHVGGGLLGRFLVVPGEESPPRNWNGRKFDLSASARHKLQEIGNAKWKAEALISGASNDHVIWGKTMFRRLALTAQAKALYVVAHDTLRKEMEAKEYGEVLGRTLETAMKIAGIITLGVGAKEVSDTALKYGLEFARGSAELMLRELVDRAADTYNEEREKLVMRWIRCGGKKKGKTRDKWSLGSQPGCISRSMLLRATHLKSKELDETLAFLLETGQIMVEEREGVQFYIELK